MKVEIEVEALRAIRDALWIDYVCRHSADADPAPFNAYPHVRAIDEAFNGTPIPARWVEG